MVCESLKPALNDWNSKEVTRAETTWGGKRHPYDLEMFNFAIKDCTSWLDLGCGFGRFLEFLLEKHSEPNYIGYDSSKPMIDRIRERFPEYFHRVFCKTITVPITHPQESLILSAVFVHLPTKDQKNILTNISKLDPKPKSITFDINCPCETAIDRLKSKQTDSFERRFNPTKGGISTFRMTWQSHYSMTSFTLKLFSDYNLTIKFYDLRNNQHKVVYMLRRKQK